MSDLQVAVHRERTLTAEAEKRSRDLQGKLDLVAKVSPCAFFTFYLLPLAISVAMTAHHVSRVLGIPEITSPGRGPHAAIDRIKSVSKPCEMTGPFWHW